MKELSKLDIDKINNNCAHVEIWDVDENSPVFERRIAEFYYICGLYQFVDYGTKLEELLWAEKQRVGFRILDLLESREDDND